MAYTHNTFLVVARSHHESLTDVQTKGSCLVSINKLVVTMIFMFQSFMCSFAACLVSKYCVSDNFSMGLMRAWSDQPGVVAPS